MSDAFRWSDFDEYLCPSHLPVGPVLATIARITVEEVFNPYRKRKMPCPVLRLVSADPIVGQKPLPLSASRRKTMARLFGNNPADAIGKTIRLQVVKSSQGNDMIQISEAVNGDGPSYDSIEGQDAEAPVRQVVNGPTPAKSNGRALPATTRLIQERIIELAAAIYKDHTFALKDILTDAVKGGFAEPKVTTENIGAFIVAVEIGHRGA